MISKTLSTSEKFAALFDEAGDLAEFCQSLYPLLVSHSDDYGRSEGDIFTVKHRYHPASPRSRADFERGLQHLHNVDLIIWYAHEDRRFIQIVKFDPHQVGLHKRKPTSDLPPPPGNHRKIREIPGKSPSRARAELNLTELKGTEQNRTEGKERRAPHSPLRGNPRKEHRGHAYCQPEDGSAFCVPEFLHKQFVTQLGAHIDDFDILPWYVATDKQRQEERPTVAKPLSYWKQRFEEAVSAKGWSNGNGKAPRSEQPAREPWRCEHDAPKCTSGAMCANRTIIETNRAAR